MNIINFLEIYLFLVDQLPEVPIGTILSWVSRTHDADETVELPEEWVRCDGGTIPQPSIWAGKYAPDLIRQALKNIFCFF